jgi:hypothetical protein
MPATAFNSLIDGVAFGNQPPPAYDNNGAATPGSVAGPSPTNTQAAAQLQGTRPLTGAHNTPLHVGAIALAALLVLWGLRHAGFSFSVAGKIGR